MSESIESIKQRIVSHRLDDEHVRVTLAGFMHQEFRHVHGMMLDPRMLTTSLVEFIAQTPDARIDDGAVQDALAVFWAAKFRPKSGAAGIKLGLQRYMLAIATTLDQAIAAHQTGLRPRNWKR